MPFDAIISDKRHFAQAGGQKTGDFGQNDGETGAALHQLRRRIVACLSGATTCCGCLTVNP
jgi:hypothetical protein